jgi:hypothetical protein
MNNFPATEKAVSFIGAAPNALDEIVVDMVAHAALLFFALHYYYDIFSHRSQPAVTNSA